MGAQARDRARRRRIFLLCVASARTTQRVSQAKVRVAEEQSQEEESS